jgi:shikimate kinase
MCEPAVNRSSRIYLTGFMASGKSTVGPILANSLGYDFVDVDTVIEASQQKSVREIFREQGEQYFRGLEREAITALTKRENLVVALGGGALTDPVNLHAVTTTGILVYLKVPPEEILKRVQHRTDRPLLTGPEGERLAPAELRKRVLALHEVREPLYSSADIVVMADEQRLGLTVDRVVKLLARFLRTSPG